MNKLDYLINELRGGFISLEYESDEIYSQGFLIYLIVLELNHRNLHYCADLLLGRDVIKHIITNQFVYDYILREIEYL